MSKPVLLASSQPVVYIWARHPHPTSLLKQVRPSQQNLLNSSASAASLKSRDVTEAVSVGLVPQNLLLYSGFSLFFSTGFLNALLSLSLCLPPILLSCYIFQIYTCLPCLQSAGLRQKVAGTVAFELYFSFQTIQT